MGFTVKRAVLAGATGLAVVVAPIALTVAIPAATTPAAATTQGPDTIQYVQTTGTGGSYFKYVPGNPQIAPTTQSLTGGGGCSTPTPTGLPILGLSAFRYSTTTYIDATPGAAVVGAHTGRTGVCSIPQSWAIEPSEALDFSVGTNALVAGRVFTEANIVIGGNNRGSAATVRLVEYLGSTQVCSYTVGTTTLGTGPACRTAAVPGDQDDDDPLTVDTGVVASGFDRLAVQLPTPPSASSATVSVIGPTSTFTLANNSPALSVTKTFSTNNTDTTTYSQAGQVITYGFSVKNTGNVTLNTVTLADPSLTSFAVTCGGSLAPGASESCVGTGNTHTVGQPDLDAGSVSNTVTATATSPAGAPTPATSTVVTKAAQSVALSVTKTFSTNNTDTTTYSQAGQVITYGFSVKNTGNVTLNTVTLADPSLTSFAVTCGGSLAPGASESCVGTGNTHTVGQPDLDAGSVSNTVTATATSPAGAPTPATSTVVTKAAQSAALSVTKTFSTNNTDTTTYSQAGQVITYGFSVKNTGNVTLNTVTLADPSLTSFVVTCGGSLAPGASESCAGTGNTHTVGQPDLDAGSVSNTVTATATSPAGAPTPATSTVVTKAAQSAALSVTKTFSTNNTDTTTYSQAGQVITYGFSVKNTGNVTLNTVTLADPSLTSFAVTCGGGLAPGASESCVGTGNTHTVGQPDLDAGSVSNTVTATATSPAGAPTPATSTVVTKAAQSPALTLVKTDSLSPSKYTAPGQVITYTVTATNSGNITLHNVTVADTPTPDAYVCSAVPGISLAPGASVTCSGTHTVTLDDLKAGSIVDTASASSTEVTATNAVDTLFAEQTPICAGNTIKDSASDGVVTDGTVTASITLDSLPTGSCKNYSYFNASASQTGGNDVEFLSQPLAGAHVSASFDWGYFGYCVPNVPPGSPQACPVTYVDFGSGLQPQTFCAAADPNGITTPPWCTTSRTYTYVNVGGITVTHITETWDGYGDTAWHPRDSPLTGSVTVSAWEGPRD